MDHDDGRSISHDYERDRYTSYHRGQVDGEYDIRRGLDNVDGFERNYNHDVDHNQGKKLRGSIEEKYDQLFQQIEAKTQHGVEHQDIYKTVPLGGQDYGSHYSYTVDRPAHDYTHPYYRIQGEQVQGGDYHRHYQAPVIHGDHGAGEYHELDREPFHGDVKHGDLHFYPIEDHQPAPASKPVTPAPEKEPSTE